MKTFTTIPTNKKDTLAFMQEWISENRCPLLVFAPGASSEPQMRRLAELADKHGLLKFAGKDRWFECRVAPPGQDGSFEAAKAEIQAYLHNARRHRNHFYGLVTLDISDRTDSLENKHFIHMLKNLLGAPGPYFGLVIYSSDEKAVREAEGMLAKSVATSVLLAPDWKAETPTGTAIGFVMDTDSPNAHPAI